MLHLPLLGGLALVGLPVLLHLLMRQKPKHILFPAFRFLQQRAKTNQRKIRLRHLLLLLLRMLLLAIICLALAWLKGKNQVGAVVLLIDTSPSMEYVSGGKSRLDEAKARAGEVLNTVATDSRVIVLETGDRSQTPGSIDEARERIDRLTIRPGAPPVTQSLAIAYDAFANAGNDVRRTLYVFSDRTANSWDTARFVDLQEQKNRLGNPAVTAVYIDLGVEKPVDVAVTHIEVTPAVVPGNREVVVRTTISAAGQGADTEVIFKLVGDPTADRRAVKLEAGQSVELEFLNKKLPPGLYQAEVALATADGLPAGNSRFVTFEVRGSRKVLTITSDESLARIWELALQVKGDFESVVITDDKIQTAEQLKSYPAVILFSVKAPAERNLWGPLKQYVEQGGNLLVIPGRDEMRPDEYATKEANEILPGRYQKVAPSNDAKPAQWEPLNRKHLLLAKFATWREREDIGFLTSPRSARRYWQTAPSAPDHVVVNYVDSKHPAILENSTRKRGVGRVVMLTTPLDERDPNANEPWNDYSATTVNDGFYVVLANELLAFMVGDLEEPTYNFASGQSLALPLSPAARFPEYTLDAPGVTGPDTRIARADEDIELILPRTNFVGNARLTAGPPPWKAALSLNLAAEELRLDRLDAVEIEKLFGENSVVAPVQNVPLKDALSDRIRGPLDLFPWLMLAFLGLLTVESIMANRFYKPEPLAA